MNTQNDWDNHFAAGEIEAINQAKSRKAIPTATVRRLIEECDFKCSLCWRFDSDDGVVIHHIKEHTEVPDDRFENLVLLCPNHHSKVHTTWQLARHPFPPELIVRRKEEFIAAISAFRRGTRSAPGRETEGVQRFQNMAPAEPVHFRGREELAKATLEDLTDSGARVALVGMGGMRFFVVENMDRESIPFLEHAVAAAKAELDRGLEGVFISHIASAYSRLGLIDDAVSRYEEAIIIGKETGDEYDLASHYQNLATTLLSEAKDLPRVERLLRDCFPIAERSGNSEAFVGALGTLGYLCRDRGNFKEAAQFYRAAVDAARIAEHRVLEGNNLSNLGLVLIRSPESAEEGQQLIEESLAIAIELGDRRGEGNRIGHLGGILFAQANELPRDEEQTKLLAEARHKIETALRIAEETSDAEKAGSWLMNLASVSLLEGDPQRAFTEYSRALALAKALGFKRLEAQVRYNLGAMLAKCGALSDAKQHLEACYPLLVEMDSPFADITQQRIHALARALDELSGERQM